MDNQPYLSDRRSYLRPDQVQIAFFPRVHQDVGGDVQGTQYAPQPCHLGRTVGNLGLDDQAVEIRLNVRDDERFHGQSMPLSLTWMRSFRWVKPSCI